MQAGGFAYLLFLFSQGVDGYFEGQAIPEQYTAHNITVSIRTIVRGLSYLCTFIFAANAVGLSGARGLLPAVVNFLFCCALHAWRATESLQLK